MYDGLGDIRFPYKIAANFPKADAISYFGGNIIRSALHRKRWFFLTDRKNGAEMVRYELSVLS